VLALCAGSGVSNAWRCLYGTLVAGRAVRALAAAVPRELSAQEQGIGSLHGDESAALGGSQRKSLAGVQGIGKRLSMALRALYIAGLHLSV